jgi:hypothetical protein
LIGAYVTIVVGLVIWFDDRRSPRVHIDIVM